MSRGPSYHRWDDDAPDSRVRIAHEDTQPQWSHSVHSTFAEPSRLGGLDQRRPERQRRSALALVAAIGAAAIGGVSIAVFMRQRPASRAK